MVKKLISRIILLLIIFPFMLVNVYGINSKITGKVTDVETGEPLVGVNVIIVGTTMGAATDIEGDFLILNVPSGNYTVKASMIGFTTVTQTDVLVSTGRSIIVNFDLSLALIEGEEVVVVAERDYIKHDVSSSEVSATAEEIVSLPMATSVQDFLKVQAGIEDDLVRGGGIDQTGFVLDGMPMNDNYSNKPLIPINLSSIKEVSMITGGFNAEYGNIRSGLIQITTKDADIENYHGSADFRYTPSYQKHSGPSYFSDDHFYLRSYLDPDVAFDGTESGAWDEYTQQQNIKFEGWNRIAEKLANDENPDNDLTPEQLRDLFRYENALNGSEKYGQNIREYANKPDYFLDMSFGGPVPFISKELGGLSFFSSFTSQRKMFALPTARDYYGEDNLFLKFSSQLSSSMKLRVQGSLSKIQTVANNSGGSLEFNMYLDDELDILGLGTNNSLMYNPDRLTKLDIDRSLLGISFDHVLSPKTFYTIRYSVAGFQNSSVLPPARDTSTVAYFGVDSLGNPFGPIDHVPYGQLEPGLDRSDLVSTGFSTSNGTGQEYHDQSYGSTHNFRFDLTSQVSKEHQIKTGVEFNIDDMYGRYELNWNFEPDNNRLAEWNVSPIRASAYVQDKIEFEGFIANVGVRLDYSNPNTTWFNSDHPYSPIFSAYYRDVILTESPKSEVSDQFKISPRLGISHPINEYAKLYFNYGHFYSMSQSLNLYEIRFGSQNEGVEYLGNPSLDIPLTVAYELGADFDIAKMFAVHIAGYYKDVSNQVGGISYTNLDKTVDYTTFANNNYADIMGFEIKIEKRFGEWITGWANYNYMVSTSGYLGRANYYQDFLKQMNEGLYNPKQEIPLARPYARANIRISTPEKFGPEFSGRYPFGGWHFGWLFAYKSGSYETWDPLETNEFQDNIQWEPFYEVDLRISKTIDLGIGRMTIFLDVNNIFDIQQLSSRSFSSKNDKELYLMSLKLPMYSGSEGYAEEDYSALGMLSGNDKPGELRSGSKDYINDPNFTSLYYLNPRYFTLGVKVEF